MVQRPSDEVKLKILHTIQKIQSPKNTPMDLLHPQLAAFAAVLEEGSFDAAARRL